MHEPCKELGLPTVPEKDKGPGTKTVKAWCDNTAVVSIVNHGSSRNKEAMHLTRCLAFITAKGNGSRTYQRDRQHSGGCIVKRQPVHVSIFAPTGSMRANRNS